NTPQPRIAAGRVLPSSTRCRQSQPPSRSPLRRENALLVRPEYFELFGRGLRSHLSRRKDRRESISSTLQERETARSHLRFSGLQLQLVRKKRHPIGKSLNPLTQGKHG